MDWEKPESHLHHHRDKMMVGSLVNWQGQLLRWGRKREEMSQREEEEEEGEGRWEQWRRREEPWLIEKRGSEESKLAL